MIYRAQFSDINNRHFQILISKEKVGVTDIMCGDVPLVINYEGEDGNIYKPIKGSTATISIVSKDLLLDLYSEKPQSVEVIVTDEDEQDFAWRGFLTPAIYSQNYSNYIDEIQLEAIDALSTLQYVDYVPISGKNSIVSFKDLIKHIIKNTKLYSVFNFPSKSFDNKLYIDQIYISENNFFDERGDAMSFKEVLEEVCKYLGVVAIPQDATVIFTDYKCDDYTVINVNNDVIGTQKFNNTEFHINKKSFAETGTKVSLDKIYNKITVKDSLYTFENILPSIFDKKVIKNMTASSDISINNALTETSNYGKVYSNNNDNVIVFLSKIYNEQKNKYMDTVVVACQYFNNENYKCINYDNKDYNSFNYYNTRKLRGAVLTKFFVKKLEKKQDDIAEDVASMVGAYTLEKYLAANDIQNLSYDNYIALYNADDEDHIENNVAENFPYFESLVTENSAFFGGKNAYILITGSMLFNTCRGQNSVYRFPVPKECIDPEKGRRIFKKDTIYILCKLQWGDKFWNGNEWQNVDTTFKIKFNVSDNKYRVDNVLCNELNIVNNVVFATGVGEKGYLIKTPVETLISGLPKFTIYKPMDFECTEEGFLYKTGVMFLKNFNIKCVLGDPTFSSENDSDTEYSNVIDENSVEDFNDIDLKICTWDNKNPNFSAVAFKNYLNNFSYVDTVNYDNSNLRFEEHLIKKFKIQYQNPTLILNAALHLQLNTFDVRNKFVYDYLDENKFFILDSWSFDVKYDRFDVKLVEFKQPRIAEQIPDV